MNTNCSDEEFRRQYFESLEKFKAEINRRVPIVRKAVRDTYGFSPGIHEKMTPEEEDFLLCNTSFLDMSPRRKAMESKGKKDGEEAKEKKDDEDSKEKKDGEDSI